MSKICVLLVSIYTAVNRNEDWKGGHTVLCGFEGFLIVLDIKSFKTVHLAPEFHKNYTLVPKKKIK